MEKEQTKLKSIADLEKKKNLKPDIKEVIKDFNKDTKIIMPVDHEKKHMKKISGDPLFAKKELEKEIKDKKLLPPPGAPKPKPVAKVNPSVSKDLKQTLKIPIKLPKPSTPAPQFAKD